MDPMDTAADLFEYLEQYGALVCKQHKYAVQNIQSHLYDVHRHLEAKIRRAIVQKFKVYRLAKPDTIRLPRAGGPPLPILQAPRIGFNCNDCGYISISRKKMRMHHNKIHQWKVTKKEDIRWTKIQVQTFFTSKGHQRWFIVNNGNNDDEDESSVEETDAGDGENEAAIILSQWKAQRLEHEKELEKADEKIAKTDHTGWFKRTGWPEHLAGRNLKYLAYASRVPDRDERQLQQAGKIVDIAIEKSVAGLSTLHPETRRWLRSAKREEIDARPMARLQNPESQARYAGYVKRFVYYSLRVLTEPEPASTSTSSESDSDSDTEESGSENDNRRNRRNKDFLQDARELFPWKPYQKARAEQFWSSLELDEEPAQLNILFKLMESIIFQTLDHEPFESPLIHFLAILGIDEQTNRLRKADNYSFMLAGVVYYVRVMAAEILLPIAKRKDQGEAERKYFLDKRKRCLADGSYSPMSIMISLLAYGRYIAFNTSNAGSTHWSADKKILYFHGKPIIIQRFRKMIGDVIDEAEQILWKELMWAKPQNRFVVPLDKIMDDVTFTKRGISFANRPNNGFNDGIKWMLNQMSKQKNGGNMRKDGNWNIRQIRRYIRKIDAFLELLLLLVHTTAGQPARGTEITSVRHQNGFLQDRNIFVIDGRVVFITRYHKSQSQFDAPKIIPRFLPWRVGQLVSVYLGYVQRFREHLMVQAQDGGWSDYLWANASGPWETERLTRIIARETATKLGNRLTTLDYRHVAITMGRMFVGDRFGQGYKEEVGEVEEPEMEVEFESELELQAGRSEKTGAQRYGVSIDIIKHLSIRSMDIFRSLSEAWHRFLDLESKETKSRKANDRKHLRGDSDASVLDQSTAERQTRLRIGNNINHGDKDIEYGEEGIRLRHEIQNIESELIGPEEIQRAMQKALGREKVEFRSEQQQTAVKAILAGDTPLVVILPTGGGKSLLFMIPACLNEPGVTIVVAPFRALVNDLVDRLKRTGIDCMEWKNGETNPAALVVVSADVAGSWSFLAYASLLKRHGLLRRVVIDECHLIFTSSDYRPKLAKLRDLRALGCQMILMTATLPPLLEHELEESMLVRLGRYIRASTVRKNIRYMVQQCKKQELIETAVQICRRQRSRMQGQKGVIYCRSRAQCEEMAEELECGFYHAGFIDKEDDLENWLEQGGFIAATSALGTGVDYQGITFVLHAGMPYGMIDFAQESGRAGRAGEAVDSMVLVGENELDGKEEEGRRIDERAMLEFVSTRGCRRGAMSIYLDGEKAECGDVDGAMCDKCGEGQTEWQEWHSSKESEWQQIKNALDELKNGCVACWIMEDDDEAYMHCNLECTKHLDLAQQACDEFRRQIVYEKNSHSCTKCGISQKLCATGVKGGMKCQWPNIMIPIVRAGMANEKAFSILQKAGYEGEFRDWSSYSRWLGKQHPSRKWGEWMSNGTVAMIKIILHIINI
jgi:superfamily II DNA helicase RecQ